MSACAASVTLVRCTSVSLETFDNTDYCEPLVLVAHLARRAAAGDASTYVLIYLLVSTQSQRYQSRVCTVICVWLKSVDRASGGASPSN